MRSELTDLLGDRVLTRPIDLIRYASDASPYRLVPKAAFPAQTQGEVHDDHTPFTRDGVPAIDLIDFDFPCWHKRCDDMSAVSRRSLDASGEAVLELLRTWR